MHRFVFPLALLTLLVGCDSSPQPPASVQPSDAIPTVSARTDRTAEARTLEWDELMPADFDPGAPFEDIDIASLADDDPKARELMARLRKLWDEAPVVAALDGARIRLPGFAVPLETDGPGLRMATLSLPSKACRNASSPAVAGITVNRCSPVINGVAAAAPAALTELMPGITMQGKRSPSRCSK